jgi:hypothetical protein
MKGKTLITQNHSMLAGGEAAEWRANVGRDLFGCHRRQPLVFIEHRTIDQVTGPVAPAYLYLVLLGVVVGLDYIDVSGDDRLHDRLDEVPRAGESVSHLRPQLDEEALHRLPILIEQRGGGADRRDGDNRGKDGTSGTAVMR